MQIVERTRWIYVIKGKKHTIRWKGDGVRCPDTKEIILIK